MLTGSAKRRLELGGEPAGSRSERSRGAVDIIRCADDETTRLECIDLARNGLPVGACTGNESGAAGRGGARQRVPRRDADTFESEVEGENGL